MASGHFSNYATPNLGIYCEWSESVNNAGNYSTVTVKVYAKYRAIQVGARSNSTIKCSGQSTYTYKAPSLSNSSSSSVHTTLLGSTSFRVPHDGDGSKRVTLSATWPFNGTYDGKSVGTISASATVTLTKIPRQSTISSLTSSVPINGTNKVTVSLTRYSSSYTHRVEFKLGSKSHVINGVGTSTSYAIPTSWISEMSGTIGAAEVIVTTYSGNSRVGVPVSKFFEVTIPSSVAPTIGDIVWSKTSSEPSGWPITQGISQGTLTMTGVAPSPGATIKRVILEFEDFFAYDTKLTVSRVQKSGKLSARGVVTDSRGRTTEKIVTFEVAPYTKPQLIAQVFRSDSSGAPDVTGEYLCAIADVTVSPVANNALKSIIFKYKRHTDIGFTTQELSEGVPFVTPASSNNTWDWEMTAIDLVASSTSTNSVGTGAVIYDQREDGTGFSFGKASERKNALESAWPVYFDNGGELRGDIKFLHSSRPLRDYVVEEKTVTDPVYGQTWTYRKWVSGWAECWLKYQMAQRIESPWGSMFYGFPSDQIDYPFNFVGDEVPHEQVTMRGDSQAIMYYATENKPNTKYKTGSYTPIRPAKSTRLINIDVDIYVSGRWR